MSRRHAPNVTRTPAPPVLVLVATVLTSTCAALQVLLGAALHPLLLLVGAVPVAVAAVAAGAVVERLVDGSLRPWSCGLAAAGAVLLVGGAAAPVTAWSLGTPVTAAWRELPLLAASALVTVTVAAAAGWRVPRVRPRAAARGGAALLATASLVLGVAVVPATAATSAPAPVASTATPCVAGEQQRNYAVSAITVDVPFNRWGKTLQSARIFALDADVAAIQNWSRPLAATAAEDPAANRRLRPRPLVLRANEGECIRVVLTNRMSSSAAHGLPADPRVGIQAAGVVMDVANDGGARVGFNADPTVGIGQSTTYYWRVPDQEGLFLFQDMATPAGGEHDAGSRGVGLYGGLAVEPAGSTWTDPRSGAVLSGNGGVNSTYTAVRNQSGELYVEADIHPPNGPSFRESIQLAQDQIPGIGMGFNYGSEPLEDRETSLCPDCVGEETWLSSWPYGDPALIKLASGKGPWLPNGVGDRQEKEDCGLRESCFVSNVFHTYTGDPTKIRFGLSGVKETHVFHLHAHQWLADPRDDQNVGEAAGYRPESSTIDSQSYGPGEAYTAELLYGAGSQNGTFGDSIFHCHLYPHFAEGYWAIMRVHDVRLDGRTATPDGVAVRPLIPLPDGPVPPARTADNPGFPGMIPGTYGYRAPQPPGAVTEGGVDGTPERPAPRLVAGRAIAPAKLVREQAVIARHNGGGEAPRGAPYADPCPSGSREVDYAVTVLQRDLVYNDAGHHDPQARVMVLTKDVQAILDGTKKVEPLFIRVNVGDCINFSLTNMGHNWSGGDAFQQLVQTNMTGGHVHLVKFDVTASDGGSNGWNYQQAAFTREQADLVSAQASGAVTCRPSATFFGGESSGCRITDKDTWTPPATSAGLYGQTIHERWYADYELRTAFTHDHHFPAVVQNHGQYGALVVEPAGFDVRDPATGTFEQPINDPRHGTPCGSRCTGSADGESVDLVGPGANDDFREYGLAVADFVPLVKKGGDPRNPDDVINPPGAPEHYPSNDPGTFSINYRNAPLHERRTRAGKPVDPAHRFSSWVFGDPETPLLQGYARDNVKLRVIQGSHEEQHMFQAHGLRWREEPDDPGSPLVNAQTIGISEAFNAEMPGFDCRATDTPCRGDYLYGATTPEGLWNGMWGIMRVHGAQVPGLLALPDNSPREATTPLPAPASRQAPPVSPGPGTTCPTGAPVRSYDVVAMAGQLVYNEHGDNDPRGLFYVLAEDAPSVRDGSWDPEPLVLRANAGDCVRVSLLNDLPASYGTYVNGVGGDIRYTLEPPTGTPMGTRVGLHAQLVRTDTRLSDGAAVGFNPDSTAGIGQTVSYEWYADQELGGTTLVDYGDVRGHRHHGLFGALVIEPANATYHDPVTGDEVRSGAIADIRVPGQPDFREATLLYEDGLDLRTITGRTIEDPSHPGDVGEVENGRGNHGEKGVNYTNAPLHRRLGAAPGAMAETSSAAWSTVFSSLVHGDPRTPVLRSYAGDDTRVRLLNGSAKPPPGYFGGFQLDGAVWRAEPYDAQTELVGTYGNVGPGRTQNAHVRLPEAGDHLWSAATSLTTPNGMWGLARVYSRPATAAEPGFVPAPVRRLDNPHAVGYAPLLPLERSGVTVRVFADADGDGTREAGEAGATGVQVELLSTAGATVATAPTRSDGTVSFSPTRGVYDVRVVAPEDAAVVGTPARRVDLSADAARADVDVAITTRSTVSAVVFEDADADGARDAGEVGLPGWVVGLDGSVPVADATTGADGSAVFPGVVAGPWTANLGARAGWTPTAAHPVPFTVTAGAVVVELGVVQDPGVLVRPVDDVDGDGAVDDGEAVVRGLTVEAVLADGGAVRAPVGTGGARVDTAGATSRVRVLRPDLTPWSCGTVLVGTPDGVRPVACAADGSFDLPADAVTADVLGAFTDGVVAVSLFQDADGDGRRDPQEAPLADWPVVLQGAVDHLEVARSSTAPDGTTRFAVPPGRYDVVPLPPDAAVPWVNVLADYEVEVVRAGVASSSGGWVQRGSVAVAVFHDRDSNGTRDSYDEPLAERTVTLTDPAGKVLATALSDGSGSVAFPTQAGSTYQVRVDVPTGWRATSPVADGAVRNPVTVTAPADGSQAVVAVGHYNTVDRTAPVAPQVTPGGGALAQPTLVSITAESGATIRYTLDGTTPTATRGMVYATPVRVSTDRVLSAVAVDAAGNASPVTAAAFDLPWTGATAQLHPSTWTATTGTLRGGPSDTAADDGLYLRTASAPLARHTADVTAGVVLPPGLRAPVALNVSVSLRSSLRSTRTRLQWFDVSTSTWRALAAAETLGLDEARADLDLPGATKAVAADGTVRIRVIADNAQPFDLSVDQVTVTAVNRR